MSIEIPEGFGQVSLRIDCSGDAEKMYITFGIAASGDAEATAEGILEETDGTIANLMTTGYAFDACRIVTPTVDVLVEGTPVDGTVSGNAVPQNTAYLVRKTTGVRGRHNQGRFFLPGVPVSKVDPVGALLPAWVTSAQTNLTGFLDAVVALTDVSGIVILHGDGGPSPTPVLGFALQNRVATQRRRLR